MELLDQDKLRELLDESPFPYLYVKELQRHFYTKKDFPKLVAQTQIGIFQNQHGIIINRERVPLKHLRQSLPKNIDFNALLQEIRETLAKLPFHAMAFAQAPANWQMLEPSKLGESHGVIGFVSRHKKNERQYWIALPDQLEAARKHASETDGPKLRDLSQWETLQTTLKIKCPKDSKATARTIVIKNSRTAQAAAKEIGIAERAVTQAIKEKIIPSFIDPDGAWRITQRVFLLLLKNPKKLATIRRLQPLTPISLGKLLGWPTNVVKAKLNRTKINGDDFCYGDVQVFFGLPDDRTTIKIPRTLWQDAPSLLATSQLHERKWTASLIRDLLGEPILTKINPRYKSSAPMKLYLSDEVEIAERDPRFQKHLQKRAKKPGTSEYLAAEQQRLQAQLLAIFPNWHNRQALSRQAEQQQIVIHEGPTNAGKTYHALQALMTAQSGWYLAPLRLLAYEVYEQINALGIPCDLVTGEEVIRVPNATITASTIEMFNPRQSGTCVVIDESQMLGDPQRGWAWTRALMEARAKDIHVVCTPTATELIKQLLDATQSEYQIVKHERLCPLTVADSPWTLDNLPAQSILIAFSRQKVLDLKFQLESKGRKVSIIYGDLPPEVRHNQALQFATGETDVCVATDAVAMGLNLPAKHVCFYEIEKFDGQMMRRLRANEVQQIGGRAGRFGKHEVGSIGATSRNDLEWIKSRYNSIAQEVRQAYLAPTVAELELLGGSLETRLSLWRTLRAIPAEFARHLAICDLTEQLERACYITQRNMLKIGLEQSLALTNAPAGKGQMRYWVDCTRAIIDDLEVPLPEVYVNGTDWQPHLQQMEQQVKAIDLYLWLANRQVFQKHFSAPIVAAIQTVRHQVTHQIHQVLLTKKSKKAQQKRIF